MIRLLGHHRHDWMNEMQVLYGYARLKRYDNLPDYMDKIRTTGLHESYLSKLGIPELIVYLLEKRIENGSCTVEVELEQEIDLRRLKMGGEEVYRLIRGVVEIIQPCAAQEAGEAGLLSIGFDEDGDELLVDFVYQGDGAWSRMEQGIRAFLAERGTGLQIREEQFGEEQAVVALALPFRT